MPQSSPFLPHPVYSIEEGPRPSVPRVFISPQRYIQGAGALDHLGRYVSLLPGNRVALLTSAEGELKRTEKGSNAKYKDRSSLVLVD